jgi:hypothetical protein
MEAANEAARVAVNGILDASGSTASKCRVWELEEPLVFEPFKMIDRELFKRGRPHPFYNANLQRPDSFKNRTPLL